MFALAWLNKKNQKNQNENQNQNQKMNNLAFFCFLTHPGAFFGAFLGPIFALLIFNVIILIWVIVVLVRHTKDNAERQKEGMKKETAIRLVISISGIMFLFGLTWLFGALTITVTAVNVLFQVLFVVFNSLQGFFIFLFFCVFNKEGRDFWKEVLSCGRYKSEILHPSKAKYISSGNQAHKKKNEKKSSTGLQDTVSTAVKSHDSSLSYGTLERIKDSDVALVSIELLPSDGTKQVVIMVDDTNGTLQSEKDTAVDIQE